MELSWKELHELEGKYGDSFYILNLRKFEDNYHKFLNSFRSIYSNTSIGYSYKTNYIPKICRLVNQMGGYAEVVSQMEYELAIKIGVAPSQIIFNGPLKHQKDLENAILAGSKVNLDSPVEVEIVADIARKYPDYKFAVGLRCNFDINTDRISRFGFDVEAGEIDDVFKTFAPLNNCSIAGLHCHFNTSHRSIDSYALRAQKLIELSDYYFPDVPPKFIDIGGGFFGNMTADLKKQFDCYIPNYQEYAQAIASQFSQRFGQHSGPELILEPGVALVCDVMQFVAKVHSIKTVRSRQIALLVGSVHNVKPTLTDKKLSLKIYKNPDNINRKNLKKQVDLVGYTCMENDCLYKDYPGEIGIGDYAVFDNIGAYTIVFKPPFIRPNSPIISYDSSLNNYVLNKRRETSQDIFSTYALSGE